MKGFLIDARVVHKMLDKVVRKRYNVDLETFLADLQAGVTDKYPDCTDLVELTKYL